LQTLLSVEHLKAFLKDSNFSVKTRSGRKVYYRCANSSAMPRRWHNFKNIQMIFTSNNWPMTKWCNFFSFHVHINMRINSWQNFKQNFSFSVYFMNLSLKLTLHFFVRYQPIRNKRRFSGQKKVHVWPKKGKISSGQKKDNLWLKKTILPNF
jgi:hypothetical protein